MDVGDHDKTKAELIAELEARRHEIKFLREESNLLRTVIGLSNDAIFAKDLQGRYLMSNSAGARLIGKTVAELIGKDDTEFFSPETAQRFREVDRQVIADGATATFETGGTVADVRRLYQTTKGPLRDDQGRIMGVVGIAQDITARKRAELALEESRRRYQAIFENALDAIFLIDSSTSIVDANPAACQLLGYSREELLQLTVRDVTPIENRDHIGALLSGFLSSGTLCGEYTFLCKAGKTVEVEYRAVANILPGLHLGVHRDISDRRRDETALRSYTKRLKLLSQRVVDVQEEERRHLARELHDEIGQDLTVIGINLLAIKGSCDPAALPKVEECIATAGHTLEQVRRLSFDLRPSILDELGLAAALRWLVDRQAQRAGLVAHFAIETAATSVSSVVATACFRVGQETLTNLVRHARAQNVWIGLHQRDNEIDLTIRDDGVGFDPVEAHHRATTGVSLGLLGMQERVALLGGRFTIDSAPGCGSRIHIRLPTAAPPTDREPAQEGGSP